MRFGNDYMELWDIYDINRNKTGKTIMRGCTLGQGEYHIAVQVCVFNSKGQMLIQQRTPFKDDWANMWDITAAGSVISGETSQQAAQRELSEELGIDMDFSDVRPRFTVNFDRGFCDVYDVLADVDTESLVLQKEEVQAVRWADRRQILEMIENGKFITYYKSFIELIFDSRQSYGSHENEIRK